MVKTVCDALFEYYDMNSTPTRRHILALDESGKDELAAALASKLYGMIVKRIEDIDYGSIPVSKGDITKVENFSELKECVDTIEELLSHFNQPATQVGTINTAIANMESSKKTWQKAFNIGAEIPCAFYNNVVLAIISGVSLLISASIEFIKEPGDKQFALSFDRAGYSKTKDKLLFSNLEKFNKSFAKGEIVKLMDNLNKSQANIGESALYAGEVMTESIALTTIVAGIGFVGGVVVLLTCVVPILHELTCFFYSCKQNTSDYFALQHQLVLFNAEQLKYNYTKSDAEIKKIYDKQVKIAEFFKKISNKFAVKVNKAENDAAKLIKKESSEKITIPDEGISNTIQGSSIF